MVSALCPQKTNMQLFFPLLKLDLPAAVSLALQWCGPQGPLPEPVDSNPPKIYEDIYRRASSVLRTQFGV